MWQPQHVPTSEVCTRCGLTASRHKPRQPRPEYQRRYNERHPRPPKRERVIGIDGEGQGRRPHRYNYLSAADELGKKWSVSASDPSGRLTTRECLDFLLGLPTRALIFGFSFIYDLTKILQDLDDRSLFYLFREEKRSVISRGRVHYRPVLWEGYRLNFINRKFTVRLGKRRATVWDVWRFFQSKFTTALIDWQIADKAKLQRMAEMKDLRSQFEQLSFDEIKGYCDEECSFLSQLGRRLIDAHTRAGLPLKVYFGAGSTASVFLDKLRIAEKRGEIPDAMVIAVASAFIGGRFENSVVGPITEPVWNFDIASAYPYQATFLPCLQHGVWKRIKSEATLESAQFRLGLIRWAIVKESAQSAWGVLPHRSKRGTISWPITCAGGWAWRNEFLAARRINPNVEFREAWVYETDCACERPFTQVPTYYRERFKLGKDAAGIPIKLGLNSGCYGKLAQSTGIDPPYQSWVWAGNVTSGCRAQLLDAIGLARNPWSVLMFATDGVWSLEELSFPAPADTGTNDLVKPSGANAALGAWESKSFPNGVFCVRPGIYFPLSPTEEDLKDVRARGLGKKSLYERYQRVLDAWDAGQTKIELGGIDRFVGAKTGIHRSGEPGKWEYKRSDDYGEWIKWSTNVSFDPRPKRSQRDGQRLRPWFMDDISDKFAPNIDEESTPYDRALKGPEAKLMELAELIAEEQPDADWTEYDANT